MKIGILKGKDTIKNQDRILITKAAERRGHKVEAIFLEKMFLKIKNNKAIWFDRNGCLDRFDLIIVRGGSSAFRNYFAFLSWSRLKNIIIVDEKSAYDANIGDKICDLTLLKNNGFFVPNFYFFPNKEQLYQQLDSLNLPLILKHRLKHRGEFVEKINSKKDLLKRIEKISDLSEWFLQEIIHYKKDIRVFVLGNKVLGAIERIPQNNDFRANIALGGKAEIFPINSNLEKIALSASKCVGLEISGVDLLLSNNNKCYVLEVNLGPQFKAFMEKTKINVPEEIVKYLESKYS